MAMSKEDNSVVLSFYESLLRISDVELLKGPHWLNDTVISFFFEYLERIKFSKQENFLFVSPEVTQCIKIGPVNEISVFLDPLEANKREFMFFALNDNEQTDNCGGSHWSLLVVSRPEMSVFHFDSSKGANQDQALLLTKKLMKYMDVEYTKGIVEGKCLQQKNGYDCGIHLLCNAELLAEHAAESYRIDGCPLNKNGYEYVENSRSRLYSLIYSLKDK